MQASAQLTGTKTVGGVSPDYPTIGAAIDALNTNGVGAGGVQFLVAAGHTEVLINKLITTTTSNAANPISFVKNGVGANPLVTAGVGVSTTVDFIIGIAGTDFVTIDGIDLLDPTSNTTSTTRIEFGYGIYRASGTNGCENITIKNCNIALQKANTTSWGIKVANHLSTSTTATTITSISGIHKSIFIQNNNIQNVYNGIYQIGSTTTTWYDEDIHITGNVITNFGGSSTTAYGIYTLYNKSVNVSNDSINGGTSSTSVLYGIFTGTATGSNVTINNNFVRLTYNSTTSAVYGIYNTAGATSGSLIISGNRLDGCASTTQTTGAFYGLFNAASVVTGNIFNNTVTNNSRSSSSGLTYLVYNSSGTNISVYNNLVSNNTVNSTSTAVFYVVFINGSNVNVYNNRVLDNIRNGGTGTTFSGIYTSSALLGRFYNNIVSGMTSNLTTATLNGMQFAGGTEVYAYNNLINNISSSVNASNSGVNGINITTTSTTASFYIWHNTVQLNSNSTGANFGSNAMFANTGPLVELANNIFVNTSQSLGTGRTVAFRRSSTTIATYSLGSNNNLFYAGTPGTNNLIYSDGTNNYSLIKDFQNFLSGTSRDQSSVTENVSFQSVLPSSNNFLRVNPASPSQTESGGKNLSLTEDFTSSIARATFPVPNQLNGGGTAPDLGAFEQDLIPLDVVGPEIVYKRLRNGGLFNQRSLNGVEIKDKSGVDTALALRPRLYFRKTTNTNSLGATNDNQTDGWKYVSATNAVSPYNFTIDYTLLSGGLPILNDTIEYFLIAADKAMPSNIRVNQATFAVDPSGVSLAFNNFPVSGTNNFVIDTLINSLITVGGTGVVDFTSLTRADGLFNAINNGVIGGNVEVNIVSDIYNENGAVALNELTLDGPNATNNTITIKSNSGARYIGGSITSGGLIKFNNSNNVIIDGEFFGTNGNLTFVNTATSGAISTIQVIGTSTLNGSNNITISNCNIYTGSRTNSSGYAVFIGGTTITTTNSSGGFYNAKIRLINNNIYRAYTGIGIISHPISFADSILVLKNTIGSDTASGYLGSYGIRVNGLNQGSIKNNRIYNIISNSTSATALYAIQLLGNVRNSVLDGNDIDNLLYTATQYNSTRGIAITGTINANVTLKNNIIKRVVSSGADNSAFYGPSGIYFDGTGSNYKLYNNTINLTGLRPVNAWTVIYSSYTYNYNLRNAYTAALCVNTTAITGLDVRNNIFSNKLATALTSQFGSNFAVFCSNTSSFSTISNNLYHASSPTIGVYNGFYAGTIMNNLSAFKVAVNDRFSLFATPAFMSDTVLMPNLNDTNVWNMSGRGMPLAAVANDAIDSTRSTLVVNGGTDLGAYEFGMPLAANMPAIETAPPAANTTTSYLIGSDTVATIQWANFSTVPQNFVLRYYPGVNPPSATNSNYFNAYWQLDGIPVTSLNFNIKFFYNTANMGTVPNESRIIGANNFGNLWTPFGFNTTLDTVNKTFTISNASNTGNYTGTDALNPLPVKLSLLELTRKESNAILHWTTSSEVNALKFEIERSYNGVNFELVGMQKAKGNSSKSVAYSFNDKDAVSAAQQLGSNHLYYRLKMHDKDGSFQYSPVKSLLLNIIHEQDYSIWPNPFAEQISIAMKNGISDFSVKVYDLKGNELYAKSFIGVASAEVINLTKQMPNGVYIIEVETNGKRTSHKILKAN